MRDSSQEDGADCDEFVTTVDAMLVTAEIPGRPTPCPRPRVGKHGTYYPKSYQEWLRGAQTALRQAAITQNGGRLMEGDVSVVVTFSGARANADIDNLCKSVLDAAQGQDLTPSSTMCFVQ